MIDEELKRITEELVKALSPQKIFLFGSFARNEEKPDSDYDIYIMMPDNTKVNPLWGVAYNSVQNIRTRPIDFVIGTVSGFEERKNQPTLEKIIDREGVLLYEKSE